MYSRRAAREAEKDTGSSAKGKAALFRGRRGFVYGTTLFPLDALENLFAMDGNVLWRIYSNAHLVPFHAQHRNAHGVTDHQCFADAASQNQHVNKLR
jgi:hypothetical protein